MLKELRFVQGAVARKDFLPSMTHFAIENNTVRSYNGTLALCAPIAFDIDCKPKAVPLVNAIRQCSEDTPPVLAMTGAGRLSIKSGKFKAFIDCVTEDTPHVLPEGIRVEFDGAAVLQAFKTVYPFIGEDASRPWANGVLLRDQSAFATNNVTLVEYWVGMQMPFTVNVPSVAITEIIRINECPTHAQVTEHSMTFHYSSGRWIRTQLLDVAWPDVHKILDVESSPLDINPELFEGLETLKPFADKINRVFIKTGILSTHTDLTEGASFTLTTKLDGGETFDGIYSINMLQLLKGVATRIDWSSYPKPCMFFGERLRGALVGMRP